MVQKSFSPFFLSDCEINSTQTDGILHPFERITNSVDNSAQMEELLTGSTVIRRERGQNSECPDVERNYDSHSWLSTTEAYTIHAHTSKNVWSSPSVRYLSTNARSTDLRWPLMYYSSRFRTLSKWWMHMTPYYKPEPGSAHPPTLPYRTPDDSIPSWGPALRITCDLNYAETTRYRIQGGCNVGVVPQHDTHLGRNDWNARFQKLTARTTCYHVHTSFSHLYLFTEVSLQKSLFPSLPFKYSPLLPLMAPGRLVTRSIHTWCTALDTPSAYFIEYLLLHLIASLPSTLGREPPFLTSLNLKIPRHDPSIWEAPSASPTTLPDNERPESTASSFGDPGYNLCGSTGPASIISPHIT